MTIEPYADNYIPVVPTDYIEHTPDNPFCYDEPCDCHEDETEIIAVYQAVQNGLMTPDEATDFVMGRGI